MIVADNAEDRSSAVLTVGPSCSSGRMSGMNPRACLAVLMLVASLFSPSGNVNAASFDCRKAAQAIELVICSDKTLSDLDAEIAKAYFARREDSKEGFQKNLLDEQRAFNQSRTQACGPLKGVDDVGQLPVSQYRCLIALFEARLDRLERETSFRASERQLSESGTEGADSIAEVQRSGAVSVPQPTSPKEQFEAFVGDYPWDEDVVAKILNYSEFGSETGSVNQRVTMENFSLNLLSAKEYLLQNQSHDGAWYALDRKNCIYARMSFGDAGLIPKSRILNLNEIVPASISIVTESTRFGDRHRVLDDGHDLFPGGMASNSRKLLRGWKLIYSEYCKGEDDPFAPGAKSTSPEPHPGASEDNRQQPAQGQETAASASQQQVPTQQPVLSVARSETAVSETAPPVTPRPRNVDTAAAGQRPQPKPRRIEKQQEGEEFGPERTAGLSSSQPLSSSELAMIRGQFERCWNPPAGARSANNLVVKVRIWLRQDGTLLREPVVVNRGDAGDQSWRLTAESAVKAVYECEPVQGLDLDKYDRWKDIELTFNPRDVLG